LLKGELEQVSSQAGRLSCDLANQQRQIIQETRTTSINASLILFLLTHRKVTGMNKHDTASMYKDNVQFLFLANMDITSGVLLKMEVGIRKRRGEGPEGTLLIYDH